MAWKSKSQYEEIRNIGLGAFGKVVLVRKHVGGNLFAVKELELDQIKRICGIDRDLLDIEEKADLMISLQHDNIVRIFGYFKESFGKAAITYHLVMEYCSGGDLESTIVRQNAPFTETEIQRWSHQLAMALQFLHDNGVAHRYVKTENVFLVNADNRKTVKLGDFGIETTFEQICRVYPDQPKVFQYCSPEFVQSDLYETPSDVWAYGVVVYRMTTLRYPFNATTVNQYIEAIKTFQRPSAISSDCSIELVEFVRSIFRRAENRPTINNLLKSVFLSNSLLASTHASFLPASHTSFSDIITFKPPGSPTISDNSNSPTPQLLSLLDELNNKTQLQPTELLTAAEIGDLATIEAVLNKYPRSLLLDPKLWKRAEANGGDTPLHRAAKRDRLDAMQLLLKTLAPLINLENNERLAAIHKAALNNSIKVVKYLVDERPLLVLLKDGKKGRTALHHAAQRGHLELVKVLLRYNDTNVFLKSSLDDENLAIHLAAENGHIDVVSCFIEAYPELKHAENGAGNQPLHVAVLTGHVPVVKLLLDAGAAIDARGDKRNYGGTALHIAAEKGHLEVVKVLVNQGADIYARSCSRDLGEFLPVHLATYNGHVKVVEFFYQLKQSIFETKDSHGHRLIHLASLGGHVGVVDFLLKKGETVDVRHKLLSRTCLHLASWKGHLKLAAYLVRNGADVWAKDSIKDYESMPIHLAAYFGHVDLVEFFVMQANSKLAEATDCQGNRPIHKAALNGQIGVVDFFLRRGVTVEFRQSLFGRTVLHYAAESGHLDLVKFLVGNGADMTARSNSDDYTQMPIHLAAEFGHDDVVDFFVSANRSLAEQVNSEGEKPIHRAAIRGQVRVIEALLRKGVSVESKDEKLGRSPLHYAALMGHIELVEMLLKNGANVYSQSNGHDDRDMPIHLAAYKGHFDVVKYLVEAKRDLANCRDGRGKTPLDWAQQGRTVNPEAIQVVRWLKGRMIAE